MPRTYIVPALLLLLLLPHPLSAEFALRDGDRVVFFGDGLVHRQGFTRYVESFVRVKYPELKVRFLNPSTRQRTATEGLRQMAEVIKPLSPTVTVVVFGFNDPNRQPLDPDRVGQFRKDYQALIERLSGLSERVVLVTPPYPATQRLRQMPDVDYAEVIGHYAQEIRELAASKKVPVVDWFKSSSEVADLGGPKPARTSRREILFPPRLAHAVLAAQLLKHWNAEPLIWELVVDWNGDTARSTSGAVTVVKRTSTELAIALKDVPLPWALPGVRPQVLQEASWPGAELCRYTVTIKNPPATDLELLQGELGRYVDRQALERGLNFAGWAPFQANNAVLRSLNAYINKKYRWQEKFWREVRPSRPEEPELHEAFEDYCKALQKFEEGTSRVIQRLPKTFDLSLLFRVREPKPAPQAETQGEEPT